MDEAVFSDGFSRNSLPLMNFSYSGSSSMHPEFLIYCRRQQRAELRGKILTQYFRKEFTNL